jgi:hypothetical protein
MERKRTFKGSLGGVLTYSLNGAWSLNRNRTTVGWSEWWFCWLRDQFLLIRCRHEDEDEGARAGPKRDGDNVNVRVNESEDKKTRKPLSLNSKDIRQWRGNEKKVSSSQCQ